MHKFNFRLDPLIRMKRQEKRLAELNMLEKNARVVQARRQVNDLDHQLTMSADVIQGKVVTGKQPDRCIAEFLFVGQICDRMQEAQGEQAEAKRQLQDAATKHRKIAIELEALENLRMRKWREYVKSRQRDSQIKLDSFVMRQWQQIGNE